MLMGTEPPATLQHIALDTARTSDSSRHGFSDAAIGLMRDSLAEALAPPGGRVPVPGVPGYSYNATAVDGALLVTIWGTVDGEVPPVLTFGIARPASDAVGLWRQLHRRRGGLERTPYRTDVATPPQAPWLASRMEIGARLIDDNDHLWMVAFERITAWAWIEGEHR
jgi:hypothetical protein